MATSMGQSKGKGHAPTGHGKMASPGLHQSQVGNPPGK